MTTKAGNRWFNLAILAVIFLGAWFTLGVVKDADRWMRNQHLNQANLVAQAIVPSRIESLAGNLSDLDDPEYLRLKEQLAAVNALCPESRFLYLMGQRSDEKLFFYVGNAPAGSEDESQPGQVFVDSSPELLRAFQTREEFCEGPLRDSWRNWISAFVPVTDPTTGNMVAMLGMDIDASDHQRKMTRAGLVPFLLTAAMLGILFAGNLMMKRRLTPHPGSGHRIKHLEGTLACATGLVLTLAISWTIHKISHRAHQADFSRLANSETDLVKMTFGKICDIELMGLASFHEGSKYVDPYEFREYTHHLMENPAIRAWGWVAAVPNSERTRFEITIRQDGNTEFKIWQRHGTGKSENSAGGATCFPLTLLEPVAERKSDLGFDLGSEPNFLQVLKEAAESGLTSGDYFATPYPDFDLATSLFVVRPVYCSSPPGDLRGFSLAAIDPSRILGKAMGTNLGANSKQALSTYCTLTQLLPDNTTRLLANSLPEGESTPKSPSSSPATRPIFAFGKTFAVAVHPNPSSETAHSLMASMISGLAGLLLTVTISLIIGMVTRDKMALEHLVLERTATLRRNEDRFRGIAETMADWIWEIDPQGKFTFCSDKVEAALGYTSEEILGRTPFDFVESEEAERIRGIFHRLVKTGERVHDLESWNLTKDGRRVCIQTRGVPIFNEKGNMCGYRGVNTDITERKTSEEALLKMNNELEEASIQAHEMAVHAERASAAKSEFLANMSHEIRTPMNGVIGMTGLLLDTGLNHVQRGYAETVRTSAESLLGLINDILDVSKIEAGKLELEALDFDLHTILDEFAEMMAIKIFQKDLEFICSVSPDTPSLLRGDSGRLRQILINLTSNALKFTSQGEIEVRASLVNETNEAALVRFSVRDTGIGIPPGKADNLFQPFTQVDASTTREYGGTGLGLTICKQLAEAMGGEIGVSSHGGQGSEFWFTARLPKQSDAHLEPSSPEEIQDARILVLDGNPANRRVLLEQLATLGARPEEARDGPAALAKLREAVSQGKPFLVFLLDSQAAELGDSGLLITIESDPALKQTSLMLMAPPTRQNTEKKTWYPRGAPLLIKPIRLAEVSISLVALLTEGAVPSNMSEIKKPACPVFEGEGIRILLAEDNIVNQKVALGLLKKFGLSADAVANGQEAIEALGRIPYDLVLMDCQMPVLDGYEATERIRDTKAPVLDHGVPIIALTANAMQGDREKCILAGMDDYISKPVSPKDLSVKLEKWLTASPSSRT